MIANQLFWDDIYYRFILFAGFTNHGYYGYQPTILASRLYHGLVAVIWVWLKIKDLGDYRLESQFLV